MNEVHDNSRRIFLKGVGSATLGAYMAFGFGCSIAPSIPEDKKTALIYGTRYGATHDTAEWIREGSGKEMTLLNIETIDFEKVISEYDVFILGSGIWIDGIHKQMKAFVNEHRETLAEKTLATFMVCGTTGEDAAGKKRLKQYYRGFEPLGEVKYTTHFGGRMIIESLSEIDYRLLENFYNNIIKKPFVSWDKTDPQKAMRFGKVLV